VYLFHCSSSGRFAPPSPIPVIFVAAVAGVLVLTGGCGPGKTQGAGWLDDTHGSASPDRPDDAAGASTIARGASDLDQEAARAALAAALAGDSTAAAVVYGNRVMATGGPLSESQRDALIQAGATEAFALDEPLEYIVIGDIRNRANQQFTENLETMFLAARVCVTQDAIGLDDVFDQHGFASGSLNRPRNHAVARARPAELPVGSVSVYIPGVVVNHLFFVFSDPSFQLVHQAVYRGVHVFFSMVGVYLAAIDLNGGFRLVPEFLDRKDAVYIRNKIKMSCNFFNLGLDITSEGLGYIDVVA